MIDEKKLIEEIDKEIEGVIVKDTYSRGKNTGLRKAMVLAEEQPKIGEWIPCNERLPKDGQKVLATHKGGLNPDLQVIEHVFMGGEFLDNWDMDTDFKSPTFGQHYMGDIIAWQPLPEPYND